MCQTNKATTLILSTDGALASYAAAPLEQAGYQVVCQPNHHLEEIFNRVHPGLVFIDSPRLAQQIRLQDAYKKIPIILAGRDISAEERIFCLESDIDCCLDPSVHSLELVARVQALLRRA
jgi:DNA-binding response OmpR family regulator